MYTGLFFEISLLNDLTNTYRYTFYFKPNKGNYKCISKIQNHNFLFLIIFTGFRTDGQDTYLPSSQVTPYISDKYTRYILADKDASYAEKTLLFLQTETAVENIKGKQHRHGDYLFYNITD